MDYNIKKAELKDLPKLIELCQKHAAYEHSAFVPEGKAELLADALFSKNPKLFCFLIENQEDTAGYFTYTFDFSTWDAQMYLHLDCLYIEPKFRGMGLGEKAVNELLNIAKDYHCVNIQFQTPQFNERAIKFYNRMGAVGKEKVRFSIHL